MTSDRMAAMMGDPSMRHLAYADDLAAIERDRAEQQERIAADLDWRTDLMRLRGRGKPRPKRTEANAERRTQRELGTSAKPMTPAERVRALWDAQAPIGEIATRTGLPLSRVYEIVSNE